MKQGTMEELVYGLDKEVNMAVQYGHRIWRIGSYEGTHGYFWDDNGTAKFIEPGDWEEMRRRFYGEFEKGGGI